MVIINLYNNYVYKLSHLQQTFINISFMLEMGIPRSREEVKFIGAMHQEMNCPIYFNQSLKASEVMIC